LLLVGTALTFVLLRPSGTAAMPTVAVLPFDDLGHKNQDYFASGVSDEILNLLAHQQTMKVLGRISAEQVAGGANPLTRARELGVAYVLDGSVRTGDGQVLVIARLTRVADGSQVWSERYQRRIGDIFAVQGDIASAVASRLAQSFAAPRPQGTTPAVYDRYLAARQLTRERREVTLAAAERLLRQAIALDPHYAPSFAELAQVIMLESDHPTAYGSLPVDKARAEAEPFARKAIALDPNLGDGYAALGFLPLAFDADSERYFRKAVQLSPQRADFHRWHAESLLALNRYDDAISEYARAVDIDPLWGLNYDHLMGALYLVGRKDEARSYARRFLALSTDDRAKRLIVLSLDKLDLNLAGELKTAEALYHAYPNERQNRINLAATLAQLGERRRAAEIMAGDDMAVAATSGDWTGLARAVQSLGSNFWGRSGWWDAAGLLVASGHSDALLRLYDRDAVAAKRTIIADNQNIAMSDIIVALRQHGRSADAEQLLAILRRHAEQLPAVGILGDEKAIDGAAVAALAGDREGAIRRLDQLSRTKPLQLTLIPGMALRHEPAFAPLATDPRFDAIEDRVRDATNAERAKAGLPPISRSAWISDSKTVLTKN
jgi:TolB-like protein/Tfp pilus assembly protein PilF